jgi:hypothetical protein
MPRPIVHKQRTARHTALGRCSLHRDGPDFVPNYITRESSTLLIRSGQPGIGCQHRATSHNAGKYHGPVDSLREGASLVSIINCSFEPAFFPRLLGYACQPRVGLRRQESLPASLNADTTNAMMQPACSSRSAAAARGNRSTGSCCSTHDPRFRRCEQRPVRKVNSHTDGWRAAGAV